MISQRFINFLKINLSFSRDNFFYHNCGDFIRGKLFTELSGTLVTPVSS